MDPISKSLVGMYLGGLGLLGWIGGSAAVAQGMDAGTLPPTQVALHGAGVPMTLDLGNITMPAATVICCVLILQYLKSRAPGSPTMIIEHRIIDADPPGGLRVVRE